MSESDRRQAPRQILEPEEASLCFIVDEDELEVQEVDISSTGIGFASQTPLRVRLTLCYSDHAEERDATLVWARRTSDGRMKYGFQFEGGEAD